MTILITGATGRIGRNLIRTLLARGESIRGVILPDDPAGDALRSTGVDCVRGNLRDYDFVCEAMKDIDAVFHLAAAMLWENPSNSAVLFQTLLEDNIRATFNVLEAAAQSGGVFKRIVLASSDEVYPSLAARYLPIDEDHPLAPLSLYGLSKEVNERTGFFYHRSHRLPVVVARFSLITEPAEILQPTGWSGRFLFLSSLTTLVGGRNYAPATDALEQAALPGREQLVLARASDGAPYELQICEVGDLVQGLVLLLDKESATGEAFNLSGPSAFSYEEIVPYLSSRTGIPYVDVRVPGPPIRVRHSIAKARSILGYDPQFDARRIIDAAVAASDEERGLTKRNRR